MIRTRLLIPTLAVILGFLTTNSLFAADIENVLHNFGPSPDGDDPEASLVLDKAGNLYGTTYLGGEYECGYNYACGTVFRLTPTGNGQWEETILHDFTGGEDSCSPAGNLIFDPNGNLYGTASGGGGFDGCNPGTVFELSPGADHTWTFKVLYSFGGDSDGYGPQGLVFDAAGNLYGITQDGGVANGGTVFELSPGVDGTWTERVLYSFTYGGTDGFIPVGGLVLDKAGNLYGITCCGGANGYTCSPNNFGCGVVFELTPVKTSANGEWTERVLHNFDYTDGANAAAGLIGDAAGNLYGTTQWGGVSGADCGVVTCGIVFELLPEANGDWTEKVLHSFGSNDEDGNNPAGTLTFDTTGNLYGTTISGGVPGTDCGPYGCGTVFVLATDASGNWREKVLNRFNGGEGGANPEAGVILDSAGNLYGDTTGGGADGNTCGLYFQSGICGTVFEITQ